MTEISHSSFKANLEEHAGGHFSSVYLLFGEAFLYHQMAEALVKVLIPDPEERKHQYEILNCAEDGQVADAIERMNTYSFFSDRKVIELRDAAFFVSRQNTGDALGKIREAFLNNAFEKAAARFLTLLSHVGIDLSDITEKTLVHKLDIGEEKLGDVEWMKHLIAYCLDRKLQVPEAADDGERLKNAIERGFPRNNILLITTDTIDKRKALYKTVMACGTVVDCAIPRGTRKADQDAQRGFLQQHMIRILEKHHKKMDLQAFDLVFKMTGFDVGAFTANLEKLVDYAKDAAVISVDDVRQVLIRTRQDPIYELTGAVSDRNALKALYFLSSLLDSGFHYLQILSAITNQMRKLMVIRGFLDTGAGKAWNPKMSFDQFRSQMIPAIRSYDEALLDQLRLHAEAAAGEGAPSGGARKKNIASDLVIAANPANAYPVFQQFLKAANFSKPALMSAFRTLHQADVKLKTSGSSPWAVLESVILAICGT